MPIGENIRNLREKNNMTQEQLAQLMGVSDRTISTWEIGTREPRMGSVSKLARIFGIHPSEIISDPPESSQVTSVDMIPIIGCVYAGANGVAQVDYQGREPVYNLTGTGDYRYLLVKGDSMVPLIMPGDLALVRLQSDVESGDLAVVIVNGDEGLIKRVQKQTGSLVLISINTEYPPRVFVGKEANDVKIWGRVMEVKRKF